MSPTQRNNGMKPKLLFLIIMILFLKMIDLDWNIIIFFILIGFLFGALSTISGIGGGSFYVSFLVLFYNLPINESIDTSTFIIMISSGAGFITYLK